MSAMPLTGTSVVSLTNGVRLGNVDRVYLDPARKQLAGFSVRQRRRFLGAPPPMVVDVTDVRAFGPDAIVLDPRAALLHRPVAARQRDRVVDLDALRGRPVVTTGGTGVGHVVALVFDPVTYRLLRIEVSSPSCPVPGLVWADEITRLGPDLIVVAETVLAAVPTSARCRGVQPRSPGSAAEPERRRAGRVGGEPATAPSRPEPWSPMLRRAG